MRAVAVACRYIQPALGDPSLPVVLHADFQAVIALLQAAAAQENRRIDLCCLCGNMGRVDLQVIDVDGGPDLQVDVPGQSPIQDEIGFLGGYEIAVHAVVDPDENLVVVLEIQVIRDFDFEPQVSSDMAADQ